MFGEVVLKAQEDCLDVPLVVSVRLCMIGSGRKAVQDWVSTVKTEKFVYELMSIFRQYVREYATWNDPII